MPHISTKGFTVVELIVVMIVAGILTALLFGPLDDLYSSNTKSLQTIVQATDTRSALRFIERDVVMADSFYATNTSDPIGPPTGSSKWDTSPNTYAGSGTSNRILMLSRYATSVPDMADDAVNPTRQIVLGSDCKTPLENIFIYYIKDNALYRRSVPDTTSPICSGQSVTNGSKQTCPPGVTNVVCGGVDAKVLSGVTGLSIDYFAKPNDPTTKIAYPGDPATARSIQVTLSTVAGLGNNSTNTSTTMVMTRSNGGAS